MSDLIGQHLMPTLHRLFGGRKTNGAASQTDVEIEQQQPEPTGEHIKLDEAEHEKLCVHIRKCWDQAKSENEFRHDKFTRYERLWRDQEGMPGGGTGNPNFMFPLIQGAILERLAREHQSLFGDDANIACIPTKPTDLDRLAKNAAYVKWQLFTNMPDFMKRWAVFDFRRLQFGRAHAEVTYKKFKFDTFDKKTGQLVRTTYKECPDFRPIDVADIFNPGEDAQSVDDFSWFGIRYYTTPDQMLREERENDTYFGIEDDIEELRALAASGTQRDNEASYGYSGIKQERDDSEGVRHRAKGFVEVWKVYLRWRLKKTKPETEKSDSKPAMATSNDIPSKTVGPKTEYDASKDEDTEEKSKREQDDDREEFETDIVVRFVPRRNKVMGIQKLAELYPDTPHKRPIFEANLINDGSYWNMGFTELLESLNQELTVNENLFDAAGQFSVGPVIFYRPASGANPDTMRYEPGLMIATENPGQDVNVVTFSLNPTYYQTKQQSCLAIAERLIGQSDFSAGRTIARPNAPKTAKATMALLERGDIRVGLDTAFLLNDFESLLQRIWDLCVMFAPEEQFFRVTGDDPGFDLDRGFARMSRNEEDFAGRYDFSLKAATGPHAKEAQKDDALQGTQILMQMPLVANNLWAQWHLGARLSKVLNCGFDWAAMVPKPQKPEISEDPKDEWLKMLQHRFDEVTVSQSDDDARHLARHKVDYIRMADGPEDKQEPDVLNFLIDHIIEHEEQQQKKIEAQAKMTALLQNITANMRAGLGRHGETQGEEPEQPGPGMPGLPPPGTPTPDMPPGGAQPPNVGAGAMQ